MKILLILVMLFFSCAQAQKQGDNTIIISGKFSLQEIRVHLFNNGYIVEGPDTTILSTNAKQFTWGTYAIKYLILRTDTAMILKPMVKFTKKVKDFIGTGTTDDEYASLTFDKYEFSNKDLWKEVAKVAKEFSGNYIIMKK